MKIVLKWVSSFLYNLQKYLYPTYSNLFMYQLKKNIYFIGLPASGKSYWSNWLSKKMGLSVTDLDALIEKKEAKKITEIFDVYGETYFRKIESEILKTLALKIPCIVAAGGGTPCYHDNMKWMRFTGTTVWLDVSLDCLYTRLTEKKEQEERPLIKKIEPQNLSTFLENLLAQRIGFYEEADISFNPNHQDQEELLLLLEKKGAIVKLNK
ncbi:MAG: shikimate kinase [Phycisphaerales bacterium]|nr:shikimate kinase [Phycisphaerales bacterium]